MEHEHDRSFIDEQMDAAFTADLFTDLASNQPPLLDIRQPAEPKVGCVLLVALNELLPRLTPAQA